jgi:acetyl esterase/lipase
LSLNLGLAPEYPFPAQLQDITAAYSHLIKNLNVDPKKVIMGMQSIVMMIDIEK